MRDLENWIYLLNNSNINFTSTDIIFGMDDISDIINLIILLVKFYIYQQRMKKDIPNFNGFKEYLKYYQKIEKTIYFEKKQIHDFNDRWKNFKLV